MRLIPLFSLFIGLLVSHSLWGQISYQATYYPGAGNPGGLNDEAEFSTVGWTPLLPGGLSTNQWSNSATIPFYFEFFGQSVSSFKTTANGVLTFNLAASNVPGDNGIIPNPSLPSLSIACFWEAFTQNPPTGTNDQVQYKIFGTAPNRQFWIRWASFEWGPSSFAYVAIVLEESNFHVHVVDMYSSLTSNWITSSVGVQQHNGFGIMAGDANQPLSGAGSSPSDNSFYTFEPFPIPPQDVKPVEITSISEIGCGYGQENISFRLTNIGQLSASNVKATYSIDGNPPIALETITATLPAGDTIDYTFSQKADLSSPGMHTVQVWTQTSGDGMPSNDTISMTLENVLQVDALPYYESFEYGAGGWTVKGLNPSWEWGTPANPLIQGGASGTKAWVTGRTGDYNSFENSWVISPCFDLSGVASDTWIRMNVWWECEAGWDGAAIQGSSDGGETWLTIGSVGASDWYNTANINSLPGGQSAGWSGTLNGGTGSGAYVPVTHPLPPGLVGHSSVRFRIAFASGGAQNGDGFAFDDFALGTPPPVHLGPSGYYCQGDLLDASNPGMTYLWSTGATTQTVALNNFTGGTIIDSLIWVEVMDSIGLFRRDTVIFSLTTPVSIGTVSTQDVLCAGAATGTIDLPIQGGLAPLSYLWNHGSQDQHPDQLVAGAYTVVITDANDCAISSDTILIEEPEPLTILADVVDVACHGDSNGSINLSTSGGFGPYTYQWAHGTTDSSLSNLGPGSYVLTITDQENCELQEVYSIENPADIIASVLEVENSPCSDSPEGSIDINLQGGTAPFTYSWSHGADVKNPNNLMPGWYGVSILDERGCGTAIDSIEVGYDLHVPIANIYMEQDNEDDLTYYFRDDSEYGQSRKWTFGPNGQSQRYDRDYTFPDYGSYLITLKSTNDCGTDSTGFWLTITGLPNLLTNHFSVYPNPSEGAFVIKSDQGFAKGADVQVLNLQGQSIHQTTIPIGSGSKVPIQLSNPPARGLYLLEVIVPEGRWVHKIELR